MSLSRKLQKWTDAGLISDDQRTRILAHEQASSGNLLKYGIGYVGAFSILLGFALIIASNWQEISDTTKLGTHFLVNAVLAGLVFAWRDDPDRRVHREGALFALWGLSLTLIALIGQVFQLSGEAFDAARLWFWITTPMILYYAQGRYLTSLWAIAFMVYVPFELFTSVIEKIDYPPLQMAVGMFSATFLPAGIWLLGSYPVLAALRPSIARTFRDLGLLWALFAASVASMFFYNFQGIGFERTHDMEFRMIALATIALAVAMNVAFKRIAWLDARQRTIVDIVSLSAAMAALPTVLLAGNDLIAMLHFVFLWLGVGYLAQSTGLDRLVNLAILLVTIRLFIGFLEVFGSMMMSGFGFIIIGCVLFALLYGARVVKRKLKDGAAA